MPDTHEIGGRALVQELGISWVRDAADRITDWNHGAEVLYGYSKAEAVGRLSQELLHTESAVPLPDIQQLLLAGREWQGELRHHRRDGTTVTVASHLMPYRSANDTTAIVEINVDISPLKHVETALRQSEHVAQHQFNELASIYGSAPVGLGFLDTDLRFVKVNQRLADFNNRSMAEHLGHSLREVLPEQADRLEPLLKEILRTGKPLLNLEFPIADRQPPVAPRSLLSSYYPVKNQFIFGINMVLVDITEHKATLVLQQTAREKIADHAELLEAQVSERTSELKTSVEELEAFSYSLSHDLRAPVRAIHTYTALVLHDQAAQLTGQNIEYLTKVMEAARRADHLIQDVLTVSRLSAENLKLQPVNIEQLLHSLLLERAEWQKRHAQIEIAGPLLPVQGQEAYLTQCLTNLVDNAVKFVTPDVVPRVRIWTEAVGAQVRVWFADNGIGISAADQPRLFTMFSRLNSSTAYGGTGIGLAIVRRAAERMGGTVGVESEPGHGSRFWLQLPKAEVL